MVFKSLVVDIILVNSFTCDPELIMQTCSVVLNFESVDEILWCDHSNETFSAVLLHGTVCFSIFYKMIFNFSALLRVKGLSHIMIRNVNSHVSN